MIKRFSLLQNDLKNSKISTVHISPPWTNFRILSSRKFKTRPELALKPSKKSKIPLAKNKKNYLFFRKSPEIVDIWPPRLLTLPIWAKKTSDLLKENDRINSREVASPWIWHAESMSPKHLVNVPKMGHFFGSFSNCKNNKNPSILW